LPWSLLTISGLPYFSNACSKALQQDLTSIVLLIGFINSPLYMFSKFFEDKPVEHLLGDAGVVFCPLNSEKKS
jgi:hypothetical protein